MAAAPYDADADAAARAAPLAPAAVAAAARALEAAAREGGGGAGGALPPAGRARGRLRARPGPCGPLGSASRWSQLELLDRGPLQGRLLAELTRQVGRGGRGGGRRWRRGRAGGVGRRAERRGAGAGGRGGGCATAPAAPVARDGRHRAAAGSSPLRTRLVRQPFLPLSHTHTHTHTQRTHATHTRNAHPCARAQAAPKFLGRQGAHWAAPADGWAFDLRARPPTPGLDLLTDYLEAKYRWGGSGGGVAGGGKGAGGGCRGGAGEVQGGGGSVEGGARVRARRTKRRRPLLPQPARVGPPPRRTAWATAATCAHSRPPRPPPPAPRPPPRPRDLLLKRDAVTSLQRRVHAARLAASGGEAGESPPSALAAPAALAPCERAAAVAALDGALAAGEWRRYRGLAERLYADGLISAADLSSCLAAALALAEEAASREAGGGGGGGDGAAARDALFGALSGGAGAGGAPAAAAAAAAAWDGAARRAQAAGRGGGATLEQARGLWAALLARAGCEGGGPGLEEVLAAGGGGGGGGGGDAAREVLRAKLLRLQAQLGPCTGAAAEAPPAGGSGGGVAERLWGATIAGAAKRQGAGAASAPARRQQQRQQQEGGGEQGALGAAGPGAGALLDAAALQERYRRELAAAPPGPAPYPGACPRARALGFRLRGARCRGRPAAGRARRRAHGARAPSRRPPPCRRRRRAPPAAVGASAGLPRGVQHRGAPPRAQGAAARARGRARGRGAPQRRRAAAHAARRGHRRQGRQARRVFVFVSVAVWGGSRLRRQLAARHPRVRACPPPAACQNAPHPTISPPRPPARYDPASGDLRLACDRFPTREENRRWCLQALHRLLGEANRADPSPGFLLARGGAAASPFL